jgi:hypothetical protein
VVAPKAARATEIGGLVSPDVRAVRLVYSYRGAERRHRASAIMGRVTGELQRRLGQPNPFGFYYVKVPGLVDLRHIRAQALDAKDKVIGTAGG